MTPFLHSLALLVLASTLVAASTPPAATTCPARLFALQASAARNTTGHENLKAVLQQPEGAAWHLDVAAEEQRATGGERIRITTFALSADAEVAGEGSKGACAELEAKMAAQEETIAELRASDEELKASMALLQRQQEATVAELKANIAALRGRLEVIIEVPSRTTSTTTTSTTTTRPLTREELSTLSKKLVAAAEERRVEEVRALLAQGAGTEERDVSQYTPLHWAARNGDVEAVKLLIEHGASVNARNVNQYTPLMAAAWSGCRHCVEPLVKAGADVNARDGGGRTPLHWAVNYGQEAAVRVLLASGADPALRDNHGYRARDLTSNAAIRALLPA